MTNVSFDSKVQLKVTMGIADAWRKGVAQLMGIIVSVLPALRTGSISMFEIHALTSLTISGTASISDEIWTVVPSELLHKHRTTVGNSSHDWPHLVPCS